MPLNTRHEIFFFILNNFFDIIRLEIPHIRGVAQADGQGIIYGPIHHVQIIVVLKERGVEDFKGRLRDFPEIQEFFGFRETENRDLLELILGKSLAGSKVLFK